MDNCKSILQAALTAFYDRHPSLMADIDADIIVYGQIRPETYERLNNALEAE